MSFTSGIEESDVGGGVSDVGIELVGVEGAG